jgi:Lon protease-like protein
MPSRLIPLFPLQVAVFPRTHLPLHIFEERYKEMVGNAIRDRSEFGIVTARDRGIVNVGCTVTVDQVLEMQADGRMDIVTQGQRRFEIASLDQEKDYLQGWVDFFDDEDEEPVPEELREEAVWRYRELAALGVTTRYREPDLKDRQVSFQLAQGLPDLDLLNVLLGMRSETLRLQALNQFLADFVPRHREVERVKALAPTNGHGGKPAGM